MGKDLGFPFWISARLAFKDNILSYSLILLCKESRHQCKEYICDYRRPKRGKDTIGTRKASKDVIFKTIAENIMMNNSLDAQLYRTFSGYFFGKCQLLG